MNPIVAILASVVLSSALSIAIVLVLRQPLFNLLVELCGNAARARFWAVFSMLFTVLSTLFGVLASLPGSDGSLGTMMLTLTTFRAGVLGLLLALVAIAFILLGAIRKHDDVAPHRPGVMGTDT